MRNQEKDAIEMAAKRQKILETGFKLFTRDSIEKVTMNNVADACGIGVATLYRYYKTKAALVLAISTWVWKSYTEKIARPPEETERNRMDPAERYEFFIDSFIDLFRKHKDILHFNQLFNLYVRREKINPVQLKPYNDMIDGLAERFHDAYIQGEKDGTFQPDIPEQTVFSTTLHIMLAVVTRYAVGLLYTPEGNEQAERELLLLKKMLVNEFASGGKCNFSAKSNTGNLVMTG